MKRTLSRLSLLALVALVAAGAIRAHRRDSASDPKPTSVAAGIEHAFETHRVVALTDPRTPALNRVVLSLVRDPAFRARTRVIVYDCCAPRYQALVDRFVSGGDVSLTTISRVWARAGPAIPRPNLFIEIRNLNRRLPAARRIRIVVAHPWAPPVTVCRQGQRCLVWGDRLDRVVADVVEKAVLKRGRNALLLAGEWKLDRRRRPANPNGYGFDSAARRIERRHPGSLFIVWAQKLCPDGSSTADELVGRWRSPAIADIRGTSVGSAPETILWRCVRSTLPGLPLPHPRLDRHVEDDVDAILITGT